MGSIDWKWLIVGIILAMFVWPLVSGMLHKSATNTKATQPANA